MQMELGEELKEYIVINTPQGSFLVQLFAFWNISCSRYFIKSLTIAVVRDQELCILSG